MTWKGKQDRRAHRRAAIRIRSEFGDPSSPVRIETVDFSAGGFSCIMDHQVEPLTRLSLRFEFPSFGEMAGQSVQGEAVVVRCEQRSTSEPEFLMAAAFTGLSREDREFLDRFVAWHETVMAPSNLEEDEKLAPEGNPGVEG